ncbi:hypothetical protein BKA64DRAFT_647134 [Cadophora sp. MPI-SDFR-AT-0126]|nr:hypothetical protein BKA64DRAFT_647134 [Leotiomycetes sp. MPI-SDFR-AT-0126]
MDFSVAGTCCGSPASCISTTGCPKKNRQVPQGIATADMPIKSEDLNVAEHLLKASSPLPPPRTWVSLARSQPLQKANREYKEPQSPMFGNMHHKLESLSREVFVETSLSASQDDPVPNDSEERSDSGVDMGLDEVDNTKSKGDFSLSNAKKRKSAMKSSGVGRDNNPKRRKGIAYPVKKVKGRRKQRSNYMSEEEAKDFRAKQTEFLHDDSKNIISEVPRFTRSQKKMLDSEVLFQGRRPRSPTGLLSPPQGNSSRDEAHECIRESNDSKGLPKKKGGIENPEAEVGTGPLQIVYRIAGHNTVLYSLPMKLGDPHI